MFSKSFKIVEPKRFEVYIEDVNKKDDEAIVKIDNIAVCKADLRYYIGNRDKNILGSKYPMNLIHEATGTIVKAPKNTNGIKASDNVVLVPNIIDEKTCENCAIRCNNCDDLTENFCPRAKFASSNYDGFSKSLVTLPLRNLVKVEKEKYDEIYTFAELISVAVAATRRCKIDEDSRVFIWGDGILGYIMSLVVKKLYKSKVTIVGKNKDKVNVFNCDYKYVISEYERFENTFDIAFECVGGFGAQGAIKDIIDNIDIGGTIILTGVTEDDVKISTRKILEKGIKILGSTRSSVDDFKKAVQLLDDRMFKDSIERLLLEVTQINTIEDFYKVFEFELNNRGLKKYVMKFNV